MQDAELVGLRLILQRCTAEAENLAVSDELNQRHCLLTNDILIEAFS